ncbi:DUF2855 family protein [Sneathiella chinensis]|uniref:DUF2855 domain-containing protein n=1 Tax=Sneathiella chinensis TaxID=349750 RepID=A0ABQ5U5V4_9PROT|nr:DUF2855 family protein [Sneathiella chinensis]GLQ07289.1 hypothetical protein GCM10007924_25100 [Sneathiella chinensis]
MTQERWTVLIDKDDISSCQLRSLTSPPADLQDGEIEVRLGSFALTANNVTYATLGKSFGSWTDMPGYWAFFPFGESAYGQLPVWGYATVTRSAHPDIPVGEELYGYFPLASHLTLRPAVVSAGSLHDQMPHRAKLAPVYNQYNRIAKTPDFTPAEKDLWPVFRPLLVTAYMIADQFSDAGYYGAEQLLISSASSKTALLTARCLRLLGAGPALIGLTSPSNREFVENTGLYDTVIPYEDINYLDPSIPTALIDMSGNGTVIDTIHCHFSDNLSYSCLVGLSHWDSSRPSRTLPGAAATPFFAPGRIKQRTEEWGRKEFQDRLAGAWAAFADLAPDLTRFETVTGPEAALATYKEIVAGHIDPQQSLIIRL